MNMDCFAFEFFNLGRAGVRENQMTDVNIGADAWMIAFVNEPNHGIDAVEQAQTERFEFEGDIYFLFVGVVSDAATGFESPVPLRLGWDDFALPHVFTEDEQ